jgi:hypothetical protein
MSDFASKVDFEQRLRDYTFDSDLSLRKTNEKVNEVKVIKLEEIQDIPSTLVALSVELEGKAVTHITKFATDEPFVVNEESLKDFARSKNCNLIVYIVAKDVLRYNLYNDNKTLKVIERKGTTLFNAFLFAPVELDRKIKIDIN